MGLGLGLQINKIRAGGGLVNDLLSKLRARSTYFENGSETKAMLTKLKNCDTSNAFGLLNTLEARSTYFENRSAIRAQLVKLENCTT